MSQPGYSERDIQMLQDEAHNQPWVLEAILKREAVVDEINNRGGLPQTPELEYTLRQASGDVELRKQQFGIADQNHKAHQ